MPPSVLRRQTLRTANILAALGQFTLFPMFFFVSIYLQDVVGHSPLGAGPGLLPLSLLVITIAGAADRVIGRLGLRAVMVAGFVLVATGMTWLAAALSARGGFVSGVLGPSLVLAVGLPLLSISTNVAATAESGPAETGLVAGLINTSQQFGAVLGVAVMAGVVATRAGSPVDTRGTADPAALTDGIRLAFLVGAVVGLFAAAVAARLRDAPAPQPSKRPLTSVEGATVPTAGPGQPVREGDAQ
ncbi:hypothetical protein [Solwaraspora sp. WMMD1047]|uniref:hypothetical protein n=1 Tax=Solwaraspora sp. WMMD1047 TaxID=3016102 RepID=UPI00324292E6